MSDEDEEQLEEDADGVDEEEEEEEIPEAEPTQPGIDLRRLAPEMLRERRRMIAEVTVHRSSGQVRLELDRASTLIGRDQDCDIVVDEGSVSRKHARLVQNQQGFFELIDLSSTNGTESSGAGIERMVLADGDRFSVGATAFEFHLSPPEEAQ